MFGKLGVLVASLTAFCSSGAAAVTIDHAFNHASDQGQVLGTLGVGSNRVYGSNAGQCVQEPFADQTTCRSGDTSTAAFLLDLPTTLSVRSLTVEVENFEYVLPDAYEFGVGMYASTPRPDRTTYFSEIFRGPYSTEFRGSFDPVSRNINMSGRHLPVSYYSTSIDHFKAVGIFRYDWAFELEVAPVPLPATLPLLFSGLALLHLAARRRS